MPSPDGPAGPGRRSATGERHRRRCGRDAAAAAGRRGRAGAGPGAGLACTAGQLGIDAAASTPAAAAGLIEFSGQVRFRHPLARFAVYRAAAPQERQSVHRALAEATDPVADPHRRAWHRAHATPGRRGCRRRLSARPTGRGHARPGRSRGLPRRAAELTPSPLTGPSVRWPRRQRPLAGAPPPRCACWTWRHPALDDLGRARADLLRAQVTARPRCWPRCSAAAARCRNGSIAPSRLARQTYRDAFSATRTRRPPGAAGVEVCAAVPCGPIPVTAAARLPICCWMVALLTTEDMARARRSCKAGAEHYPRRGGRQRDSAGCRSPAARPRCSTRAGTRSRPADQSRPRDRCADHATSHPAQA